MLSIQYSMRVAADLTVVCFVCAFFAPWTVNGDANSDLSALEEEFYRWHEKIAPEFATSVGGRAYNDKLMDMSLSVFQQQYNDVQEFINRTKAIDRSQLSREQQYSYDTFMDTMTTFTSNYIWKDFGPLNPINFMESFFLDLDYTIEVTPFDTKGDFENYIARMEARPTQIDQIIARMDESVRLGTTYHLVSVRQVPEQISQVTSVAPRESTLYKPFNETLDKLAITQNEKDDLRSRAEQGLRGMWTAMNRLSQYISGDYSHHTRGTYGVGGLPSGGNYYRACLKWHLSVDMAPSQVHQTGLKEVDRISQLMHQVMTKQGFNGTVAEYYSFLKAQPRFHKSSAEEILKAYDDLINVRIYPKLPQLFKDIPDSKVRVKALPYDGPYGMYSSGSEDGTRPGTFYANVLRPNDTSTFSMVSLTLHETVPGHHLQSIYQLAAGLPDFVKNIEYDRYYAVPFHFPFYTAYTEGWGLYAEYLGEELGVYQDDNEKMGRYGDEIFRACRLVVDTGLHYFGWSREKAISYLREHTPMPRAEVEIEIDRYITWPGQACAYKIGELKIKELRERAKTALGSSFDVREFHSLLLNHGPVPLGVMETIVNDYISDNGRHHGEGTAGVMIG
ncbi:hypothetical protein BaRGS_00030900 [Batillaria attramentaria]|uniref:DUF885 domain-containing protein n=1 Tax=Batillaria attramentaria TaxID=370345 RepID=A0ABD0JSI7_9CAEN